MGAGAKILVADDEPNLRRVLTAILRRDGYDVSQAANGAEALEKVADAACDGAPSADAEGSFDVIITDLKMPKVDGMEVLRQIGADHPSIPVIMITAFGSVGNAVEAVKAGAFDYIEKPFEQEQIRQIVAKAVKQAVANRTKPQAQDQAGGEIGRYGLIGTTPPMTAVFEIIEKVADTPSTVLITGESGTGKELVAKALHEQSSRRDAAFIKINCAAIPKDLMESELFGYEKGAFTGATNSKPGRFELADGGTLFLDEIGEIPVEMQVKLLRAIQESEFERVGGIKTIKVDVRLITATNRDLEHEVKNGNFREDLYYRLNVVPLQIPPLRDRRGDIPLLVEHIVAKFNTRLNKQVEGIAEAALALLAEHGWDGNIRELENVLERTILFCSTQRIEISDLPAELRGSNTRSPSTSGARAPGAGVRGAASSDTGGAGSAVEDTLSSSANGGAAPETSEPIELGDDTSLKEIVRAETSRVERELIARALDETSGNVTQAAKLLKISRKSLQMKMKDFGLRDRENTPTPPRPQRPSRPSRPPREQGEPGDS